MDHSKSDECGGEGGGSGGKFSVYCIIFFFYRDKYEYFYSGTEIFIFVVAVVVL